MWGKGDLGTQLVGQACILMATMQKPETNSLVYVRRGIERKTDSTSSPHI